jgi:hypothetical protein
MEALAFAGAFFCFTTARSYTQKKVSKNMRSICAAAATTLAVGISGSAIAATSDGDFAVYGWGARDCNAIVAILGGDQAAQAQGQMAEWISGYISSQNRTGENVYDLTPIKTHYPLVSLAKNICADNSDQLFENVVYAMVDKFSALRLPTNGPVASLSHNGNSLTVNEATVLLVQEFLITEGLLEAGSADGKFGSKTALAVETWQKSAGLTPNGLPDMVTLFLIAQKIKP